MTLLQNLLKLIDNIRSLFRTLYDILDSQIIACIFSNNFSFILGTLIKYLSAALRECLPFNFILSFCLISSELSSFTPIKINKYIHFYYHQSWTMHTIPTFSAFLFSSFSVSVVLFTLHRKFNLLEYFNIWSILFCKPLMVNDPTAKSAANNYAGIYLQHITNKWTIDLIFNCM